MSEELPDPPARLRAMVHKVRPDSHRLEPVVDWPQWLALRGESTLNTAAKNVGESIAGGSVLELSGLITLIGTPHTPGAEAVSIFGVGMVAAGALAFTSAIAGTIRRSKIKAEEAWLIAASHQRLDEWLRLEWHITPKGHIFNDDSIVNVVHDAAAIKRVFTAVDGKHYWLERNKGGVPLTVISDAEAREYAELSSRPKPQRAKSALVRNRDSALPASSSRPQAEASTKLVDPLAVFSKADRHTVTQAFALAEELVSGDLDVEQRYEVERSQKVLREAIGLAAKLNRVGATKKRAALVDLMVSVNATAASLQRVRDQLDAAVVRDVEVLRNYTAALNPKSSPLSLPE